MITLRFMINILRSNIVILHDEPLNLSSQSVSHKQQTVRIYIGSSCHTSSAHRYEAFRPKSMIVEVVTVSVVIEKFKHLSYDSNTEYKLVK